MSRRVIALLVASALVIGSIGAGAQTAAASVTQTAQPPAAVKNEPPLTPGSAAGIREAQGIADVDVWFISGLIVAAIVAALLLADDDDDSTDGTDGD